MQPTDVLLLVTEALESLGIVYCVGGSFASSAYGEPRATRDVDVLAALPTRHVAAFASRLEADFFLQRADISEAVALAPSLRDDPLRRASFNLVHRSSFFRVDIFVASGRLYEQMQFARRVSQVVAIEPDRSAYFVSPEDIVLIKLDWFRMAQGALERQWNDVLSVLETQSDGLDVAYLRVWAAHLGIADLLELALQRQPPPRPGPSEDNTQQMRLDL
jgi:hypothetical protein